MQIAGGVRQRYAVDTLLRCAPLAPQTSAGCRWRRTGYRCSQASTAPAHCPPRSASRGPPQSAPAAVPCAGCAREYRCISDDDWRSPGVSTPINSSWKPLPRQERQTTRRDDETSIGHTLRSGVPSPGERAPSPLCRPLGLLGGSGGRRTLPPAPAALGREVPPGEQPSAGEPLPARTRNERYLRGA